MPHSIETVASSRKKTKETIRVESLIPLELRERAQALIDLLQDYYTHLNEKGQTSYAINLINNERDLDLADEEYLDLIQKEIAISIPKVLLADKVTLYKNLMRYYSVRGSTESVQLFFKILFNDNVEVYYPKNSMLIPSSGTWDKNYTASAYISLYDQTKSDHFEIYSRSGTGTFEIGEHLYGATSHAETVVRSVTEEASGDEYGVDGIVSGQYQFEKGETIIGETALTMGNYSVSESVSGTTTAASATVDAIVDDATVDLLPVSGTFTTSDYLLGATTGTKRKVTGVQKIVTLGLNTFSSGDALIGQVSRATGSVSAISTNVIDVTYTTLNSKNAPVPGFFQVGEAVKATSGTSANIRRISAINTKQTFDVASGATFTVGWVVSGQNSGARGTIESISSNTIVVTGCTGAFRNGENLLKDINPTVYSAITTTPSIHSFLTLDTYAVNDAVTVGLNSGIVIASSLSSVTLGYVTGTFSVGDVLAEPSIARKVTSVTNKTRLSVNNFAVGETLTNGTKTGKTTSVLGGLTRQTFTVTNGSLFTTGRTVYGQNSKARGTIESITTNTIVVTRCAGIFANAENLVDYLNHTIYSAITSVSTVESFIKLQKVTNGPFVAATNLTGGTSGVIRKITTVGTPVTRVASALYKADQYVFSVTLDAASEGPDDFRVGELAIGQTSGEFARVVGYIPGTTYNKLVLKNPSGNFTRLENIRAYHADTSQYASGPLVRQYTEGYYTSNLGFLDDTIKVQDSYFYQKFSYVIRTGNNVDVWKNSFNRLVHPSGFIFFGEILLLLELINLKSAMPSVQPGLIYDDLPVLILLETFDVSALLAAALYRMALDVPTGTDTSFMLKYFDGNPMSIYDSMTIQQADGFSQETPVGSAYAWDDYTIGNVINNQITWNGVTLGANLI